MHLLILTSMHFLECEHIRELLAYVFGNYKIE